MKHLHQIPLILVLGVFMMSPGCKKRQGKSEIPSFSFAFMTDIHIQPEKKAAEGFHKAIDKAHALGVDFVITGGDLIMDALGQTHERADSLYQLYMELAHRIKVPVYNTMGNHEIYGWYVRDEVDTLHPEFGKKIYENRIAERYYTFTEHGWKFYILDSVHEIPGGGGYYGYIDTVQYKWLKKDLETVEKTTPIVISTHIPFISSAAMIGAGSMEAMTQGVVIGNSKAVLDLFEDYNLKLVLQGHLHYLEDIYVYGTHYITGGAVSANWWNGPRYKMEEGFVHLTIQGEEIEWEYIDYGWEAASNAE